MFSHLTEAVWYSKFDLKAGFWQHGIRPSERYKTGFCIPNKHFQWKVMPFGIKTAPSLFQKAMVKIFDPIMHTTLVYIDDILLFSKIFGEHLQLIQKFADLCHKYGIMF